MFDIKTYQKNGSEGATIRNLSWSQMTSVQSALSQHGVKFLTKQVDEAAQPGVQLTGATCPSHGEPISNLIHYECGCSTTRPRN